MPARGQSIGETIDEENHQGSNPVRSPHTVHSPRRAAASFNQRVEPTADGAVSLSLRRLVGWSHSAAVAHPGRYAVRVRLWR
jgi:hypothetical protein